MKIFKTKIISIEENQNIKLNNLYDKTWNNLFNREINSLPEIVIFGCTPKNQVIIIFENYRKYVYMYIMFFLTF
jgi:hypothetical protein